MARIRTIKPSFFLNDELARLSPLARLAFPGLWCLADREGRLEDRPARIKAQVLPYDDADMDTLLSELASAGFIVRYQAGSSQYIQIRNFAKHQSPHVKEGASTIPAPDLLDTNPPGREGKGREHDPCPPGGGDGVPFEDGPFPLESADDDLLEEEAAAIAASPPSSGRPPSPRHRRAQPAPKPSASYSPEFEAFWAAYPRRRRVGKAEAAGLWRRAVAGGVESSDIMAGLARWKACKDWLKDDGEYVCAPAVWLRGRRWEDEPEPARSSGSPGAVVDFTPPPPKLYSDRPWWLLWSQVTVAGQPEREHFAGVVQRCRRGGWDVDEGEALAAYDRGGADGGMAYLLARGPSEEVV